jgi:hypothetical protein
MLMEEELEVSYRFLVVKYSYYQPVTAAERSKA